MIVENLANKLTLEYGGSQFGKRSLHRMMQFATTFPDITTVTPLVTQLSWSHFLQVIPIEEDLAREFYLTMAADQRWSKRTLKATLLSRNFFCRNVRSFRTFAYLCGNVKKIVTAYGEELL